MAICFESRGGECRAEEDVRRRVAEAAGTGGNQRGKWWARYGGNGASLRWLVAE